MTLAASISIFRKNLIDYIDYICKFDEEVVVIDEKRRIELVRIVKADKTVFMENLKA